VLTYYSRASAASHSGDSILLLCSTSSFALLDKNYLTPIFTLRNGDCDDDTTESQSPSKRTRPCSLDTLSLKIFLTLFPFLVIQHLQSEPLLTWLFLGTNYSSWMQMQMKNWRYPEGLGIWRYMIDDRRYEVPISSRNLHDTPCTFLGDPKWKVQLDIRT